MVRVAWFFERADLDVVDAHLKGLLGADGDGGGPLEEEGAFPHGRERVVEERQLRLLQCAPLLLAQGPAVPADQLSMMWSFEVDDGCDALVVRFDMPLRLEACGLEERVEVDSVFVEMLS